MDPTYIGQLQAGQLKQIGNVLQRQPEVPCICRF
jgi:hypothetical protein